VADFGNDRIQVFGVDGSLLSSFGARGSGDGQFQRPADVAVGSDGSLYVTDHFNDRVERFSGDGHYQAQLGTLAAASVPQLTIATTSTPTPLATTALQSATPASVTPTASVVATLTPVATSSVTPAATLVPSPSVLATSASTPVASATATSAASADTQLRRPEGVTVDRDGNLWVADYGRDRIVKLAPDGRLLQVLGGHGSDAGQFVGPKGVAVDPLSGHVYVTDTGNARIQRLAPDGTPEATWTMPPGP
jgi:DNA-binding beta-propeller fold protein YncE